MKYKHIHSAIHNFGHSFTSRNNYVDGAFVIDELTDLHSKGNNIEVDWLTGRFSPETAATARISKSIDYWRVTLQNHLDTHEVDLPSIVELKFIWLATGRKFMSAIDDRGKSYKIYVNESK